MMKPSAELYHLFYQSATVATNQLYVVEEV